MRPKEDGKVVKHGLAMGLMENKAQRICSMLGGILKNKRLDEHTGYSFIKQSS